MKSFTDWHKVSKQLNRSFSNSFQHGQQSTLWVGNIDETPIAAITFDETRAEIVLNIQIPEIDLVVLDVQVTQETVLIRGQWKEIAGVEGFFHPAPFECLIPLPHAVHPETVWAEVQPQRLSIQLAKQVEFQQSKVRFELSSTTSIISQQCA